MAVKAIVMNLVCGARSQSWQAGRVLVHAASAALLTRTECVLRR
jgi:hypothetical protein